MWSWHIKPQHWTLIYEYFSLTHKVLCQSKLDLKLFRSLFAEHTKRCFKSISLPSKLVTRPTCYILMLCYIFALCNISLSNLLILIGTDTITAAFIYPREQLTTEWIYYITPGTHEISLLNPIAETRTHKSLHNTVFCLTRNSQNG